MRKLNPRDVKIFYGADMHSQPCWQLNLQKGVPRMDDLSIGKDVRVVLCVYADNEGEFTYRSEVRGSDMTLELMREAEVDSAMKTIKEYGCCCHASVEHADPEDCPYIRAKIESLQNDTVCIWNEEYDGVLLMFEEMKEVWLALQAFVSFGGLPSND